MRQGTSSRRSRGRGPRKPHVPLKQQTFDSNGPDIRVRGNAYQVLEKYLGLARDAQSAGDRIAAENFLQHAEHYYRLINANNEQNSMNGRQRFNNRPDGGGLENSNSEETGETAGGTPQQPDQQSAPQHQPQHQTQQQGGGGRPRHHGPRHHGPDRQAEAAEEAGDPDTVNGGA